MKTKTFNQELAFWMCRFDSSIYENQSALRMLHNIAELPRETPLSKKECKVLQGFLQLILALAFISNDYEKDWERYMEFHMQ